MLLEEAQRAEKHLAMKVREFDQLSSTINESACKKIEDENISFKEQVGAEVKRLQEVETVKMLPAVHRRRHRKRRTFKEENEERL